MAEYTDIFKKDQINFDEVAELAKILRSALGRKKDHILISALDAATAGTTVGNDVGGTDTDMNYEKFLAAMGALDDADVPEDGRTFLMNHRAYRSLLNDDEFINSDYGQMRFDRSSAGAVKPFLGFNIVTISDRIENDGTRFGLPKDGSNDLTCFAFHRDAVGLGVNKEITSNVTYENKHLAFLSTVAMSAGAIAIDADGIVDITCRQA